MADIDLKTETPDTTLPTTGFLFGADSQAAASPSVYSTQTVATTLLGSTSLTGATVTTSQPVLNMSQTWNASGVTFTGLKFNATDTASASGSLLMDLQLGGSSKFNVRKDGAILLPFGFLGIIDASGNASGVNYTWGGPSLGSNASIRWTNGGPSTSASVYDTILTRRAAANLRLGAADAAAPVAQTLSVQSVAAGQTNTAGANLTITGSQGTGTGAGGSIIFQVAPAGSSGTAQNALATALTIGPNRAVSFLSSGSPSTTILGNLISGGAGSGTCLVLLENNNIGLGGNGLYTMTVAENSGAPGVYLGANRVFGWASNNASGNTNSSGDTILARDAANTLALRNGANAQVFRVYNTFTDASNFERGSFGWSGNILTIGTTKSGTGSVRGLDIVTDGNARLSISSTGVSSFSQRVQVTGNVAPSTGAGFEFGYDGTTGVMVVYDRDALGYKDFRIDALTLSINPNSNGLVQFGTGRVCFGGTTSSFPALKRSSASLIVRLADDSANAALESASIKTDAPTGGTAATWKLGTVATVSPTSPNRTIEVEIGGTTYYISAKTTND